MKRLSLVTLVFALLSAVFFLVLVFFRTPFALYPLISNQDALDILTPLVLIPLYWLLFKVGTNREPSRLEEVAFMILAALWALGHGMHLAANSINNLIEGLSKTQVIDITGTDIYALTYFLDEHLSHYAWHTGILGLTALLIYREWRAPARIATVWWATLLGGLVYGFTYFSIVLEGQTVPLGLPFAVVISLLGLFWARRKLTQRPLLAFFLVALVVATLLFAGWRLYWGGLPQFSEAGLL